MGKPDEERAAVLKERSRKAFDRQAAAYDEAAFGRHARSLYPEVVREVAAAARRARSANPAQPGIEAGSARVLGAGCGTGALAALVLAELPECRLTGTDLSPAMLAVAQGRLGDAAVLRQADTEALPFHDGAFDIVYCCDSFHHCPDPERAAFELWRVLASGDELVLADCWQPAPARTVVNALLPLSGEGDVRIYSENELKGIIGTWFPAVSWRRAGNGGCVLTAWK